MSTLTIQGPKSVGEARTEAAQLAGGSHERKVADLIADGLDFIRQSASLRPKAQTECSHIDAIRNGLPNPDRPFLTGACCDEHSALRKMREQLVVRAAELGFAKIEFDVNSFVTV